MPVQNNCGLTEWDYGLIQARMLLFVVTTEQEEARQEFCLSSVTGRHICLACLMSSLYMAWTTAVVW